MFNFYHVILSIITVFISIQLNQKYFVIKEGIIGPIVKPLQGLGEFVVNFPVIFGVLVDACINFFLSFVDIIMSLFNALSWIINLPGWVISGFMFLLTAISDILTLMILWINPITMIKGIIKLMIFMIKLIFMTLFSLIGDIGGTILEKLLNGLKGGLWGVPHGPDQHLEHSEGNKSGGNFNKTQYGLYGHHHKHDHIKGNNTIDGNVIDGTKDIGREIGSAFNNEIDLRQFDYVTNDQGEVISKEGKVIKDKALWYTQAMRKPVYHPMRCYRGIGANGYLNIVATILCPPLGVFMSYGLKGILKIVICALLTLLYYFPGLIYALLITTHLGIGREIDTSDCGGSFGGLITEGCPKRKNKIECEEAKLPHRKGADNKELPACFWQEDNNIEEGGRCYNLHFRYDNYDKLQQSQLNPDTDIDRNDRFNITGNTQAEYSKFSFAGSKDRDMISD